MKTAKKALLLVLCGCLLVAGSVLGTMAYFTSQDEVVNTFTVGKVEISLDEAQVDPYGVPSKKIDDGTTITYQEVALADADRVKANTYKIIPGHKYTKDPTVKVLAGSEDCYVRMLVSVNKQEALDSILPNADLRTIFQGYDETNWILAGETEKDDVRTYEFRYAEVVDTLNGEDLKLDALFDGFTVPGEAVTEKNINNLQGLTITVVAHAIQADGFETDANAAWAAFDAQNQN